MKLDHVAVVAVSVIASLLVVGFWFMPEDGRDGRPGRDGADGIGAAAGPEVSFHTSFGAGVTEGGRVVSTSTNGTSTLVQADLQARNGDATSLLKITPTAALTVTFPATSTLTSVIPDSGDTLRFLVENAATSTFNLTLAAGAGMDLQEPDGQNVVIGQNNYAWVTMIRDNNTDIVVLIDETIPAD